MSQPVTFDIGGRSFPCRSTLPVWRLMKLTKGMSTGDDFAKLAIMGEFIMAVLAPEVRDEADAFLDDAEFSVDDLNKAIGTVVEQLGGRPKDSAVPQSSSTSFPNPVQTSPVGSSPLGTSRYETIGLPTAVVPAKVTPEYYRELAAKLEAERHSLPG